MDANAPAQDPVGEAWRRYAAGDPDTALAMARLACEGPAPAAQAAAALGFFLIQAGRLDEAAAVLLPACERSPDYAPLHWYAGYLLQRRGDKAGAAAAFLRACEHDGTLDEAAYALAWVLIDLGRIEEAARWAAQALARRRSAPRLLQMGWLHQARGLHTEAALVYREAMVAFGPSVPEQALLHLQLSQCLVQLGQNVEAEALLRRALDRWPLDAGVLAGSAWQRRDRGDDAGALRLARELV
ncbi:MAG: tetratricopeptide repeat protein, partial [Ramlibacter sp.]